MAPVKYAYLNGEIVPWEDATVHVASVGFKFGTAVFEGVRGYWNEAQGQLWLFQLREHMERLSYSQRFMRFDDPVDTHVLGEKVVELARANELRQDIHIVPTVFVKGLGEPGATGPVGASITTLPRKNPERLRTGVAAQVSSWMRVPDNAMPMRVKCNANYQNGRLAAIQARVDGYDTCLMLNARGKVAEGHGMCFFMIRGGRAVTPTVTSDILESITRRTMLELLPKYLDMEVQERDIDRSELMDAEEAFYCGTAWEVTPIVSIDRFVLGDGRPGPRVSGLQQVFFDIATGTSADYPHWRTPVYGK